MKNNLKIMRLVSIWCIILLAMILTSCAKEEETPAQKPPTVTITSPTDYSSYVQGDTTSFSGTGEDAEDGTLSGASLVWTSNIDDQIGTGTSFTKVLSAGLHTVTLTATDSDGATGSESITVIVSSVIETE